MKTVTAVQLTVYHDFEILKTEQRPVKTSLNWSFEPENQANLQAYFYIKIQTNTLIVAI